MDFPDGPSEYTITTVHYRVEDADAIDAWVDLRKNRVVSFQSIDGNVDPGSRGRKSSSACAGGRRATATRWSAAAVSLARVSSSSRC